MKILQQAFFFQIENFGQNTVSLHRDVFYVTKMKDWNKTTSVWSTVFKNMFLHKGNRLHGIIHGFLPFSSTSNGNPGSNATFPLRDVFHVTKMIDFNCIRSIILKREFYTRGNYRHMSLMNFCTVVKHGVLKSQGICRGAEF